MAKKYEHIEEESMMLSEAMDLPLTNVQSEQLEALWTLIKSQGRLVQEKLLDRLNRLFSDADLEIETAQHKYVKESLHRAFENMRKAEETGKEEQTLDEFLNEL